MVFWKYEVAHHSPPKGNPSYLTWSISGFRVRVCSVASGPTCASPCACLLWGDVLTLSLIFEHTRLVPTLLSLPRLFPFPKCNACFPNFFSKASPFLPSETSQREPRLSWACHRVIVAKRMNGWTVGSVLGGEELRKALEKKSIFTKVHWFKRREGKKQICGIMRFPVSLILLIYPMCKRSRTWGGVYSGLM